MTLIQHSLIDTQQVSLATPVKQPDNGDGFEAVLNTVVLEETSKPVDLNNLIAENQEDLPTLESDIYVREQTLTTHSTDMMIIGTAKPEQNQSTSVNLTREHAQKEILIGMPALKKPGLKALEIDGTEMDPSMMIPLVPVDVRPNPITFIIYELKEDGETLQANLTNDDSLEPSINLTAMARDTIQEIILPLSVSKERVSHVHAIELMPTAQSISNMMNKPTLTVRSTPSKMTKEIQSDNDDRMMDEVPIVSIALKRDPVMRDVPVKKSDSSPENEMLTLDHTAVSKPKISAEVAQTTKETDSFESDFEAVEPLSDSNAKEAVLSSVQSAAPTESPEIIAEVSVSKPAPTQQLQQAILDAKEGVSPKESKTLTVVLNPEELGVVNVELKSDGVGKLSAVLSVEKRETLDVLQHDIHQLKAVLKEIGIDESSISLQLSSNNEQGQQKQSEYVAWEEREQMLMRSHKKPMNAVTEKATYLERPSLRRLDIKA